MNIPMPNSEIFHGELMLFRDQRIAEIVRGMLNELVPPYFFVISASATGKYHPWPSLGYGGLVRHTKAAFKLAYDLMQLEQYSHLNYDCVLAALLLHDTFKRGKTCSQYTVAEHPLIAADEIMSWANKNVNQDYLETVSKICDLISTHSGQWNEVASKPLLPKPITDEQKFVHLCDYLASRRYIIIEVG